MTLGFLFNSLVYESISTQLYRQEELSFSYKTHSSEQGIYEKHMTFLFPSSKELALPYSILPFFKYTIALFSIASTMS